MMTAGLPGWDYHESATCAQVGEHALIRWIASVVGAPSSADVLLGIGDDAAVVVPRRNHVDVLDDRRAGRRRALHARVLCARPTWDTARCTST